MKIIKKLSKHLLKLKSFIFINLFLFSTIIFTHCTVNAQTILKTIYIPGGSCSRSIGIDFVTNRIYVDNGSIKVINGKNNRIIKNIDINGETLGIGVNSTTNRIYADILFDSSVTVIDGKKHQVIANVKVDDELQHPSTTEAALPPPYGPEAIEINSVTNQIYVTNFFTDTLSVIDGNINQVVGTVTVGNNMKTVGVNPVTNRIYVIGDSVKVIDGETNTIIDTIRVSGRIVRVNPITNHIYIAGDNLNIINGKTNRVVETIMQENGVVAMGLNPLLNRIYVSRIDNSFSSITLQTIDGKTNEVINILDLGDFTGSGVIKVNPVNNRIYITNCLSNRLMVLLDDTRIISRPNPKSTLLPDNLFTVNCDKKFTKGHKSFDKLVLESGGNENCVVKLTNLEPESFVEFSTNIESGLELSIKVYPISAVADFNGELEFTISAINKGTDWISWAVKNKNGEFDFSKKAFDSGTARGMFVEVE